jgi:transcriptional regulator with XRE-family HTH domain
MSKDLNEWVARNFRGLWLKLDLSQEETADKCGLHRTYIGTIERGKRNITLRTLQQIASALRVEPFKLLPEDGGDK